MKIVCLDFEGVLVPEIWIGVAEKTGIEKLKLTTRDVPDYDELMKYRLKILEEYNLGLPMIQKVISDMKPLKGAKTFLSWLSREFQVVILSDTYYEFAKPLLRQLKWPTLFCHHLNINRSGKIVDYQLRMEDHKRQAVKAFKSLKFTVYAVGDSYNDVSMLKEANQGIFFRPPKNVSKEFPAIPVTQEYKQLKRHLITVNGKI